MCDGNRGCIVRDPHRTSMRLLSPKAMRIALRPQRVFRFSCSYRGKPLLACPEPRREGAMNWLSGLPHGTSTMILVIYELCLWLAGFLLLWRIPRPRASRVPPPRGPVSVVIPARNEERSLPILLDSLRHSSCAPDEIIVVDDCSDDATAEAARGRGARVIRITERPEGWMGKPWACWRGAAEARGDTLVFLDADTRLDDGGFGRILGEYSASGSVLSVAPYHQIMRPGEALSLFFNIVTMAATGAFTAWRKGPRAAMLFGPCIVIGRAAYDDIGGHAAVKDEVVEDVMLGRELRSGGRALTCLGGKGSIRFRMYPGGLKALVDGWTRGIARGAADTPRLLLALIVGWIAGLTTCALGFLAALLPGMAGLLVPQAVLYLLCAAQLYWMARRIGSFGALTALLFPIPLFFFHFLFFRSRLFLRHGRKVMWKGRELAIPRRGSAARG
jgi:4,4'-diaponeurosporenoate glycosyltransferase